MVRCVYADEDAGVAVLENTMSGMYRLYAKEGIYWHLVLSVATNSARDVTGMMVAIRKMGGKIGAAP